MPLVNLRTPEGKLTQVEEADVQSYLDSGFTVETSEEAIDRVAADAREQEYGGVSGALSAGALGAARGASLGLSDVILRGAGADPVQLRGLRETNRGVSIGSEILGAVAPAILSGGTGAAASVARATPAGALSRSALGVAERVGAGSTGRYVAGAAAGGALEGAVQNVGSYISDIALENKELSAEGFLASAGQGALWGGAAGGALAGVERGTIAARRLFPRSKLAPDKEAIAIADAKYKTEADDLLRSGDELEKVALSTLDDLKIRGLELNLEREKLRQVGTPASRIRLKEIDLERAKVNAQKRALRAEQNAERAAKGLDDLPPEPAPATPPLDEASVVPRGPPLPPAVQEIEDRLARGEEVFLRDINAALRSDERVSIDIAPDGSVRGIEYEGPVPSDAVAPDAPVAPSEPPAPARSTDLAGADDLMARLGATKGLLDEGMELSDIGAAARAAGTAQDASMLADDAVRGGQDAVDRLQAKIDDYAQTRARVAAVVDPARKQSVKDYVAALREKAGPQKYEYRNSFTGEKLGGLAPVKTDRVRTTFTDEPGSVYDRVWAGIGDDVAPVAARAPLDPVIPPGWVDDDLFKGGAREIRTGIPTAADADSTVGYVVRPSDLAGSGKIYGNPKTGKGTKQQIRDEWARGDKLSPVDIQIDPDGRMFVIDGNHRLHVAAETDRPILARFTRVDSKRKLGDGDRILTDAAPAPGKVADDLPTEWEVAGKKVRLVSEERTLPSGQREIDVRIMRKLGDGEEVPVADAQFWTRPDTGELYPRSVQVQPAWQRKGLATRLYKEAEGRTGMRVIPSDTQTEAGAELSKAFRSKRDAGVTPKRSGAELDRAYDDLIERASQADDAAALKEIAKQAGEVEDEILSRVEARGGRDAELVAQIRARRAEFGWTPQDVAMRRAEKLATAEPGMPPLSARAAAEDADIAALEAAMRRQQLGSGRTAGEVARDLVAPRRSIGEEILSAPSEAPGLGRFIDDADEAIRAIGDFERAEHALVQELGAAAPPSAAARAADYAAALDDQARKTVEATAASADEAARAASLVSLPKAPPTPESIGRRAAGRAADVAGALEVIRSLGDVPFLPDPANLPLIGPVLHWYLKYRGVKAMYNRWGGRIGATAEAKVAARSAEIRDKAADAVEAILGVAPKAAKAARKPAVVGGSKLLAALNTPLYPDGEKREKPKSAAEATKARVAELGRAVADPEAVKRSIRQALGVTDPDLAAAIEAAALRKLQYLQKHAPKAPPPGPLGTRAWTPSQGEIDRFARRVRAAEDPLSVLRDLEAGSITPEAADTLRVVYPQIFAEVQTGLLTRAAEIEAKLPYQQVVRLSLLFDVPLDDSLRPKNLLTLQQAHQSSPQAGPGPSAAGSPAGQPPAPSVAAPVQISRLYETAETRRASRR